MTATVAVVDYGMGNLRSVCKAIEHIAPKQRVLLSGDPGVIRAADRVVFPGQGAIAGCMRALAQGGLGEAVREAARTKPFLGICLGLQALFEESDEGGGVVALGLLPGKVPLFQFTDGLRRKVPHMGWNRVRQQRRHPLWQDIDDDSRFYFVHSYYAAPANPADICGVTEYGLSFASAAGRDNIFAVQFHPEKSQQAGLTLLQNFCLWDGTAG